MTGFTIALDAMGGDFGPSVTVPASVQALSFYPSLHIILIGDELALRAQLDALSFSHHPRLRVLHAPTSIPNSMPPAKALRGSQGSSMRVALELVANGEAQACVSAGNTGALMALSRVLIKLLPGIHRPALVSELPVIGGHRSWLLDLGANVSVDAETLFQFGLMGSVLAQEQLGFSPKVALLNVGEEEIKGNQIVKRCAELMQRCRLMNYIGYLEGDQLYSGKADVIVGDGFVGNLCLKTSEGLARLFLNHVKQHVVGGKLKRFFANWIFGGLLKQLNILNPDQYNGASLLGLRGIVVKSHGRADISAFQHAIGEAIHEVDRQLPKKICDRLEAVLLERHC